MEKTAEPEITPRLIAAHGITEEEYGRIGRILGRNPNYTELGIFSLMWSEHCSYKSSRILLSNFPTKGERVLQGPGENAGIVDVGGGWAVAFKMESHNHPSYIEPYQGAATGVGGILRDVFTMGARPIALLDSLRFGSLANPRTRYLVDGVVAGIAGYGNCVGVPTVGGDVLFDDCYDGNILVNVFCLGILRGGAVFKGKASGVGNPVIYTGSKTGRDGIHGATMASAEFSKDTEEKRPTVQVGDPFTEKLLIEACLEAMKTGFIVGIQDMGAAGLTSSSSEMAGRAGTGMLLDLDRVPRRESGMTPYEIMISESQERMLMVVERGREEAVLGIFGKWGLDATVVGEVTGDGILRVLFEGREAARIPAHEISDEAPKYSRPRQRPQYLDEARAFDPLCAEPPQDLGETLLTIMGHPDMASKRWVYEQYDHMVRINSVVRPGSDAAVLRLPDGDAGLALTIDVNGRHAHLDPFTGAAGAVAEASRNLSCSGALPLAVTDCLNFGNPEKPAVMWQLEQAVLGMAEACRKALTPVVSGNVSLYNETEGRAIFPTPTVGMVGILPEARKAAVQWFSRDGDLVCLLGKNTGEAGGSEYVKIVHGRIAGVPPAVRWELELAVQAACRDAVQAGLASSAHDCSEGGLAAALAECCVTGPALLGAEIELSDAIRSDLLLFGEAHSRIILSLPEENLSKMREIAAKHGAPISVLGRVGGDALRLKGLLRLPVGALRHAWNNGFTSFIEG